MRGFTILLTLLLLSAFTHARSAAPAPVLTLGRGEIVSAAWAPDGQSIWISTTAGTWQLDTELREIAAYAHITYAALSPDGTKLAGVSLNRYAAVWNAADGQELWQTGSIVIEAPVVPVWSPDNDHFVANVSHYIVRGSTAGIIFSLSQKQDRLLSNEPARYTTWSASGQYVAAYDPYFQKVVAARSTGESVGLENAALMDLSENGLATYLNWRGDFELAYSSNGDGSERRKWSIPDGAQITDGGNCAGYGGCAYSPDGRYAAFGTGSLFQLWITGLDASASTSKYETELGYPSQPKWRPDSQRVSAVIHTWPHNEIKSIFVLDLGGSVVWERNELDLLPRELLWSPDGTRLFAYDVGGRMAIIDAENGASILQTDTLYDAGLASFDPGGEMIAVAGAGGSVYLVDSATGTILDQLRRSGPMAAQIMWQPDRDPRTGTGVIAIRDRHKYIPAGPVSIWTPFIDEKTRIITGTEVVSWFGSGARSIAWKPDGTALAIGMNDDVMLWADGELTELPLPERIANHPLDRPVVDFYWRDEQELPVAVFLSPCMHCDPSPYPDVPGALYDYNTDSDHYSMPGGWGVNPGGGFTLMHRRLSASGTSSPDDVFTVISTESGVEVVLQGSNTPGPRRAWVSPLGAYAAIADLAGSGLIWDAASGQPLDFLADVYDLVWTPDDSTLAILRRDGSLWLRDADGLRLLWTPVIPVRAPGMLVWSGDGTTLAHTQDGVVRVWRP